MECLKILTKQIVAESSDSGFYQKHTIIHPRKTQGQFTNLRKWAVWALLGLYYILPWLKMNGQHVVLFDLPARKFYILGQTFWPQDIFYLAVLLILAALMLIFRHGLGRAGVVWLCLPANGLERSVHLD